MESKDNKKELYLQKRILLSELSRDAEKLKDNLADEAKSTNEAMFWNSRTINYMLLNHMYDTNGATEFNTFNQWKQKGATILKGSKAFAIWGQPIKANKQTEQKQEPEKPEDKYKYFPICYLFSNLQVVTTEERQAENIEETENIKSEKMEALVL